MERSVSQAQPALGRLRAIRRTAYSKRTPVQDMSVNHCGAHVMMTQEFLDRTDVVAILEQMSRK
jgi:hypothetical protein